MEQFITEARSKHPCENRRFREEIRTFGMELPEDKSCGCDNCKVVLELSQAYTLGKEEGKKSVVEEVAKKFGTDE